MRGLTGRALPDRFGSRPRSIGRQSCAVTAARHDCLGVVCPVGDQGNGHTGRVHSSVPAAPVPAGLPGWRRAACLGCGARVIQARDSWVTIGGSRSGSYLVLWGADPLRAFVAGSVREPDEPVFLLGVAHTRCTDEARNRLESGTAELSTDLPVLEVEIGEHLPRLPYTLDQPTQIDACAFCDSRSDLTQEHVWPDWYSKELRTRGATLTGDIVVNNRIEVIVPVCGDCNNKWMSVLENDCKPLMISMENAAKKGSPSIDLSASDQTRIATWAVKTAYLIDAYQAPVVPRGFLHQFALDRVPNEWTAVWVAGYTPDVAARSDKRPLDFLTSTGEPSNNSPNAFIVTFTILNILFQVVGHFNGGNWKLQDDRWMYAGAVFRIWPNPAPRLTWPPALGFSRDSWDGLVTSIKDKNG